MSDSEPEVIVPEASIPVVPVQEVVVPEPVAPAPEVPAWKSARSHLDVRHGDNQVPEQEWNAQFNEWQPTGNMAFYDASGERLS